MKIHLINNNCSLWLKQLTGNLAKVRSIADTTSLVFWIIAFTVLAGGHGILWFIITLIYPIPQFWQLMLIGWILIINLLAAVAAPGGCYCGCGEKNASCCSCLARCTGLCLSSCCVDIDTSYKLGAVLSLITRLFIYNFSITNISLFILSWQNDWRLSR